MAIEVVVPEELSGSSTELLTSVSQTMGAAVGQLLLERGLEAPEVRVVVARDIMAATAVEGERLGLSPDRRSGAERVGGVVGGKCLMSHDHQVAAIIIGDTLIAATDGAAQLMGASILGHEFGHLLYDIAKTAAIGPTPDVGLPWEVAGVIAAEAAEEYRVDLLGNALADILLQPTKESGEEAHVAQLTGPLYTEGLSAALGEVSPSLEEEIFAYRRGLLDMGDMWQTVVHRSEGIVLYVAHTEANNRGDGLVLEGVDYRAAQLLEPVWRPLFSRLAEAPTLPEQGAWESDRRCLLEIGLAGFTEFWRRLGLAARPEGEGYYLSVFDPDPLVAP